MALDTNATRIANLIDPEVLADYVNAKLTDAIKFAPLATIDNTLQGRSGDTLSIPTYAYIGDAEDVAEGADIDISQLTSSKRDVKVKKAGKGVQLTDEAVLNAYGDPVSEVGDQFVVSISSKIDNDFKGVLNAITGGMVYSNTETSKKLNSTVINKALVKFGEDFEGEKILYVAPAQHADLLNDETWIKATDMGVERLVKGVIGMISGCQVVVSNKIVKDANNIWANFIVKPGALGLLLKREMEVEMDRDIINKSTVLTTDKHYATYLKDATKAIKITTDTTVAPAGQV